MGSSGKGIGIVALLLALGALGLGVYQLVFASPISGGASRTYITSSPYPLDFNLGGWRSISSTITYNTEEGDLVLLEFSCFVKLDIAASTYIKICFVIDSVRLETLSYIYIRGDSSQGDTQDIYDCAIMRHYIQSSTADTHTVSIDGYIDDSATSSFVSSRVLTVTIY